MNNRVAEKDTREGIVFRPDAPHVVVPVPSMHHTDRTVAQQGNFTLSINILGDQEALIAEASQGDSWKWTIPKEAKPEFLFELNAMNITAATLFPGEDGLGRSVAESAKIEAHFASRPEA